MESVNYNITRLQALGFDIKWTDTKTESQLDLIRQLAEEIRYLEDIMPTTEMPWITAMRKIRGVIMDVDSADTQESENAMVEVLDILKDFDLGDEDDASTEEETGGE